MLRAIILSLVLFVAFGTVIPVATEYSEASVTTRQRKYNKKKRAQKYRRMALKKKSKRRRVRSRRRARRTRSTASRRARANRRYRARKRTKAGRKRVRRSRRSARRSVKRYRKKRGVVSKRRRAVRKKRRAVSKRRRAVSRKKKRVRRSRRKSTRRYTARKRNRVRRSRTARKRAVRRKVRRKKRVRKYTNKWWANYHAQQRRKKAVAVRKRSQRLRAIRAKKNRKPAKASSSVRANRIRSTSAKVAPPRVVAPPRMDEAPVAGPLVVQSTSEFSVEVVGAKVGETVTRGRNTLVGGVSTTTLRRTVIDQMIRENGWVENDYQKELGGKKVYVVIAKAPDRNNNVQMRTYYFTESNGRIYRVATKSPQDSTEQANKKSEEMIRSLDQASRPQQAKN